MKRGDHQRFRALADYYDSHVLPHARAPGHRGQLDTPTRSVRLRNPRCGDEVRLDLAIDEQGRIAQARFEARGCLISQAAADLLCEHIEARTVDDLRDFTPPQMLDLLKVPLTPARRECGLLAWRALRVILASFDDRETQQDGSPGPAAPNGQMTG